jgi:hypothetical protein
VEFSESERQFKEEKMREKQAINGTRLYSNGRTLVGPDTYDLTAHREILPRRNTGQNLIAFNVGTLSRTLTHYHGLSAYQALRCNPAAVLAGGSCTFPDLAEVEGIQSAQPYWETRRRGAAAVNHPTAMARVVTERIATLSAFGGNGGDPQQALRMMETDPSALAELERLAHKTRDAFSDFGLLSANLLSIEGFGGTYPVHRYFLSLLESMIEANLVYRLMFVPSPEQFLHVRNAQGVLRNLVENGVAEGTLAFIVQLEHGGAHEWDPALAAGMLTLSMTAEQDPVTIFRLLKERSDFIHVRPTVVDVPMRFVGKGFLGRRMQWVLPETVAGGQHLHFVLDRIRHLARQAPDAAHVFAASGYFSESDIAALKEQSRSFLRGQGQLHVLVNPMLPAAYDGAARYYVTDFVAARQLPKPVVDLFERGEFDPVVEGVTRQELISRAQGASRIGESARAALEIEEALRHIRSTRAA